jgi:hypothetical protein
MPWSKQFWNAIILKDGRVIVTLSDARDFMVDDLPDVRAGAKYWQYAAELLLAAAESGKRADIDAAGDQFARAAGVDGYGGERGSRDWRTALGAFGQCFRPGDHCDDEGRPRHAQPAPCGGRKPNPVKGQISPY